MTELRDTIFDCLLERFLVLTSLPLLHQTRQVGGFLDGEGRSNPLYMSHMH